MKAYASLRQAQKERTIEMELGDIRDTQKFIPRLQHLWYHGECGFWFQLKELSPGSGSDSLRRDGSVVYKVNARHQVHFYPVAAGDEGGYEFESRFSQKPISNVIGYTLHYRNVAFYYQDFLAHEDSLDGCHRPDSVIGSYAVYASRQRSGSSQKISHIYRPYAKDANGNKVWCDLNIDTVNHEASITIPQKFLDTCAYPMLVDPTFGYTTIGGSTIGPTNQRASHFTSPSDFGSLTSMSLYCSASPAADVDMGLYDDNSGVPNNRLVTSGSLVNASTVGWYNLSFSYTGAATTVYWLAHFESAIITTYFDTGAAASSAQNSSTSWHTWSNPWGTAGSGTRIYSIYVTYTASGGNTAYANQYGFGTIP